MARSSDKHQDILEIFSITCKNQRGSPLLRGPRQQHVPSSEMRPAGCWGAARRLGWGPESGDGDGRETEGRRPDKAVATRGGGTGSFFKRKRRLTLFPPLALWVEGQRFSSVSFKSMTPMKPSKLDAVTSSRSLPNKCEQIIIKAKEQQWSTMKHL